MQDAVQGLYLEIERLQGEAAKEAKAEAQLAIIREISHDLKTPHSLIAKYFELHLDTVRTTGCINEEEVKNVRRTLKRMGELLRQVLVLPNGSQEARKE